MSDDALESKPKIVDANGEEIAGNEDNDDTYLGVEKYSGVCLITMERTFMNMVFYGDDLFKNFTPAVPEYGYFFPLVFVDRNSKWTQQQVDERFGSYDFKPSKILEWVLFALFLVLAITSVALMICYGYKYCKLINNLSNNGFEGHLLESNS